MNNLNLDSVISATNAKKVGDGWLGHCPTHDDKSPSLAISEGGDGKPVVFCHAGCESKKPYDALAASCKETVTQASPTSNQEYLYQDESGKTVLKVVRCKNKKFFQKHHDGTQWRNGGVKVKLAPYRIKNWIGKDRVFLVEGEKDVESLEKLGINATTTVGGSGAWSAHYAKYFKDKQVVILPDNDDQGRIYSQKAANDLLFFTKSVLILNLPNLKPKGDVSDWIGAGGSKEKLEKLVVSHGEIVAKQTPLELFRAPEEAKPYPIELLGEVLAPAIEQVSYFTSSPIEICAQSFLAAASLAVQPHYDVVVGDRENPLSLNFFTISQSGGGKSSADKYALQVHKEHQKNLWSEYQQKSKEVERMLCAYNESKKEVLRKHKGKTPNQIDEALESLGDEPAQVVAPHLILEDLTTEALTTQLNFGLPYLGIISDEGGQLLGGYSFNSENSKKTAANMTKLWEGGDISVIRASGTNLRLYGKRVCVHLMAQPKMASEFMQNEDFKDQGCLNRMLIVWPKNPIGNREFKTAKIKGNPLVQPYFNRIQVLLDKKINFKQNFENALDPQKIHLSEDAENYWLKYRQELEHKLKEGEVYGEIQSFATRAPQQALRLSAVLSVFDGHESQVNLNYIEKGCELATYYVDEYKRVSESSMLDTKLLNAQKVLTHIKKHKKYSRFYLAQIYQKGPNVIRNASAAREVLAVLEDHYHIKKIEGGEVFGGVVKADSWEVIYDA